MCTNIVEHAAVPFGSGRGKHGWFPLSQVHVSYDHPFHVDLEHAVNVDFVNEAAGLDARIAVELSIDSARNLAAALLTAVERAEAYENG
ncbi:MAG: hypothetical protein C0506_01300 [Anaerolinea sp.]|nr:hypothetical protein [Anaerolinea sp.]